MSGAPPTTIASSEGRLAEWLGVVNGRPCWAGALNASSPGPVAPITNSGSHWKGSLAACEAPSKLNSACLAFSPMKSWGNDKD
jgi:hypothetical protein